ncbi:hypothetical protein [Actinotalea sp. K2]|uniref:hypothetical protein n=1 Tax=Actinotalea sp. K2 TaxID=2939438 RepID=UPI00201838D4|nr:hypothetical protein [Actinotalea sp. K2]MCL3863228.1 hypothetical protein [Actinotalea sp. K2]
MLIYADGSALACALGSGVESASWMRWSFEHRAQLVTSPLGVSELRRAAQLMDPVARARAHQIATSVEVVRFFDQSLGTAAMASTVLDPFGAIHLGIVVAHPEIEALATYDTALARVASIYGVPVVSPGRAEGWWEESPS